MIKKFILCVFLLGYAPMLATSAEFQWLDKNNAPVNLSALQGKPVVLHFWASWCPPCRGEIPSLVNWIGQHPDVNVVMVSLDRDREDAQAFFSQHGITLPLNMGEMRDAFSLGVRGLPATLILDAKGDIVKRRIGDILWDDKESSDEVLRWL